MTSSLVQVKIHVDIREGIEKITLKRLPDDCLPWAVATDKLAGLKAKQLKAAGAAQISPFPFIEVSEFTPPWAEVNCLATSSSRATHAL